MASKNGSKLTGALATHACLNFDSPTANPPQARIANL